MPSFPITIAIALLLLQSVRKASATALLSSNVRERNRADFSMALPDEEDDPCVNRFGEAKRCIPEFVNTAFGRQVEASSTCGALPQRFCPRRLREFDNEVHSSFAADADGECELCDASSAEHRHPASFLTDLNNPSNLTYWVSEPFLPELSDSDDALHNVTLRLALRKKFELTYITLLFYGHLPDSLAIFKSSDYGRTWIPMQYYSSDCETIYGVESDRVVSRTNEQEAVCTDIAELNAAASRSRFRNRTPRIPFSTLAGRPSIYKFDSSPVLQDWVTATDVKIELHRARAPSSADDDDRLQRRSLKAVVSNNVVTSDFLPTVSPFASTENGSMPDNAFDDYSDDTTSWSNEPAMSLADAQRAQFYAIVDLAVGGRCRCNG